MLVKVCNICGEKINDEEYIVIESGRVYIKSGDYLIIEEGDICMKCARAYNLVETVKLLRNIK